MKKHLTDAEINLAREIFLRTMQPVKTQDFNQQMAECSIRLARLFTAAVCEENRHCNEVDIDPIYTSISVEDMKKSFDADLPGELAVKYPDAPRFDEMACCYEKFNIFGSLHKAKYEKIKVIEETITCNVFGVDGIEGSYIEHTYPDWVVAKFTDKNGVVWGASSDKFQYVDGMGIWVADNPSPKLKLAILMYEKCTVAPQDSLVSIDLPF